MCCSVPVYSVSSFMSYPCLALVDSILIPPLLLRFGHCHRYLLSQIYKYICTILRIIGINISFRLIFILFQVFPSVSSTFPGDFSGEDWRFSVGIRELSDVLRRVLENKEEGKGMN